jgi:hypothetical protein
LKILEGLSRDPKTSLPVILNQNDRKLVCKQFPKHIIQIFETLGENIKEKQFEDFMSTLTENIKNLGARVK